MTETMLAAVFKGEGQLELEQRPVPQVTNDDDVIIRVRAVGICGSDLHALHVPATHPGKPGVIFGHEFCGEIVEVGPAVQGLVPGDSVAVDQNPPCGRCGACREGRPNFCEPLFDNPYVDIPWPNTPGFFWDGGMATYVKVPSYYAYKVDPDIPKELVVLAEPLGCALNAVNKVGVSGGDTVAVIGGGPIGLLTAAVLRHYGAGEIIVIEPSAARGDLALKVGASRVVNPKTENVREAVLQATKGRGASIVIEAVGSQLETAIDIAADEARIAVLGIDASYRASVAPMELVAKELKIFGVFLMRYTMREALDLIESKALPLEHIVTDMLPLSEVDKGIALAHAGQGLKIVFTP